MDKDAGKKRAYPWIAKLSDLSITFRWMDGGDRESILELTRSLPERELLFLRLDITRTEVVDRWIANLASERTVTLLAAEDDRLVGYCSLHRDELVWTRHMGEIRMLVHPNFRGKGIGRQLADQVFELARESGLGKLVAHMMSDQRTAQNLFHHLGFIPEALLHDWVIDRKGKTHDLIIMSCDLEAFDPEGERDVPV